jgi:SAM-dependent methyltransferase
MTQSKAWNWNVEKNQIWYNPSEESYYLANRWKEQGYRNLLDFGCGLGRHSIFFSQQGFNVSAFDLSVDGINHLKQWATNENQSIDAQTADMIELPYPDNSFDCLFAYHVIYHTDSAGFKRIMNNVKRITKPNGEVYITLGSKESWSYAEAGYPMIDENTVRKTDEGPEKDVPHFYVNLDDVISLFNSMNMELLRIRYTDDCYFDGQKQNSKHYFVLARNPEE